MKVNFRLCKCRSALYPKVLCIVLTGLSARVSCSDAFEILVLVVHLQEKPLWVFESGLPCNTRHLNISYGEEHFDDHPDALDYVC